MDKTNGKDYIVRYNIDFFKSDEDFINEMYKQGYELVSVSEATLSNRKFYFKKIKNYEN